MSLYRDLKSQHVNPKDGIRLKSSFLISLFIAAKIYVLAVSNSEIRKADPDTAVEIITEINQQYSLQVRPLLDLDNIKKQLPIDMPHNFLRGDIIPKEATQDWNLGPTGIRGWMFTDKLDTAQARQICVLNVAKGSPAHGKLFPQDVILGVEESLELQN